MGRAPCCDKANVKKGPWSPEEDAKLKSYIEQNGTGGNWIALPQKIGLKRCGKSCRLRWLNYLRPNIKHGGFSEEEDRIICILYGSIGSRWSIIAAQLPGRTDNDIKNYWNTRLKKKLLGKQRNSASSTSGRRYKRSLLVSDHHHADNNSITIPSVVLPNSANFNLISNSEAMFPYTSWPPIVTAATATTASNPNSCGFGEMRSLLMKLDQNVYYDGMVNIHPPLITNDHHEIDNDQLVNMMGLDGGQMISPRNDLGAISSFPRELEELMMSSTSNQATQRMGGLDQFLGWDQDYSNSTVMINNNAGATAGSETSCGSMGSWCEMSSLISPPMEAGNASCTEGIPPRGPVFDHQLIKQFNELIYDEGLYINGCKFLDMSWG